MLHKMLASDSALYALRTACKWFVIPHFGTSVPLATRQPLLPHIYCSNVVLRTCGIVEWRRTLNCKVMVNMQGERERQCSSFGYIGVAVVVRMVYGRGAWVTGASCCRVWCSGISKGFKVSAVEQLGLSCAGLCVNGKGAHGMRSRW